MNDKKKSIIEEVKRNKSEQLNALKKMLLAIEKEQLEIIKTRKDKIKNNNHEQ